MLPNAGMVRVLGIGGSLRDGSISHAAIDHVLEIVRDLGCRTESYDLRRVELPFCNGDKKDPRLDHPCVGELREAVRRAHALVLATPEYHGGMSGVLKNALDLMDFEHLEGKVIGAISVLGGRSNCNALNDIRRVARSCRAWTIPEQVALPRARTGGWTDDGPRDLELATRLADFAASLVRNTLRLNDYFLTSLVPLAEVAQGDSAAERAVAQLVHGRAIGVRDGDGSRRGGRR
jgi:FMN reductase